MYFPIALALMSFLQDSGPDDKPYPEMVLPHVIHGRPDKFDAQRPVVNVRIDGMVLMGDAVYLDGTFKGEDARRGWANLRKELARVCEPMGFSTPASGGGKVRKGSVLVRADLNSPFVMTLGVMEALTSAEVLVRRIDFAVGDARAPKFDPAIGLVPQSVPQHVLHYVIPTAPQEVMEEEESEEGTPPKTRRPPAPVFSIRVKKAGTRLNVQRAESQPWEGDGRFRFDMSTRHVEYSVGTSKVLGYGAFQKVLQGMRSTIKGEQVVLNLGPQVTAAEALSLYDSLLGLGVKNVFFSKGRL